MNERDSFANRAADGLSRFLGTWTFVFLNFGFFISWVLLNTLYVTHKLSFDPWPYILLNLILSMMAAFENPIILMGANRLERVDREIASNNYSLSLSGDLMLKEILEDLRNERKEQLAILSLLEKLTKEKYEHRGLSESAEEVDLKIEQIV